MDIITMDAETFFSSDYTLSSLTTEEYVRNERFECHGWAIRMPNVKTFWLDHLQFYAWAETIDWSQTAVLCHHAHFDGLILSHHYGVVPALYLDTYSMARALLGTHISKGLESLAKEFGLGAKTIPYDLFKGKHWHELSEQVRQQVARGACDDVSLTWDLFQKLAAGFPKNEYAIVDATVRMFTCPRLVGNTELLGQIWQAEERKKQQLLSNFIADFADHPEIRKLKNQDPEELIRKDWVFATLLRANGI
ncbi:MAG: hypothetical protein KGL35_25025, partial [Bradyrhizobium sp.]|nr:hypothetical protein [Bradyrhizobium sp.]